jgi:urease accessory protein
MSLCQNTPDGAPSQLSAGEPTRTPSNPDPAQPHDVPQPAPLSASGWRGRLQLRYRHEADPAGGAGRTVAHDLHEGPLRVLQRLYPEGDDICHHVMVHPPGGIVGGDILEVDGELGPGAHALITTPGATRFYRSGGAEAVQRVNFRVAPGARLEWLPLETIAYDGCLARNQLRFDLAPGAQMMGWDVLALGLPAARLAWTQGRYHQRIELPGLWLDQAALRADDDQLRQAGPGWAGHGVLASLWWAAGGPVPIQVSQALVELARVESITNGKFTHHHEAPCLVGTTSPEAGLVVVRVLSHRVEPAMALLRRIRLQWRALSWKAQEVEPRIWGT